MGGRNCSAATRWGEYIILLRLSVCIMMHNPEHQCRHANLKKVILNPKHRSGKTHSVCTYILNNIYIYIYIRSICTPNAKFQRLNRSGDSRGSNLILVDDWGYELMTENYHHMYDPQQHNHAQSFYVNQKSHFPFHIFLFRPTFKQAHRLASDWRNVRHINKPKDHAEKAKADGRSRFKI